MSAQALYDAVRGAIDAHLETDEELSTFELIGVLRMISAELELAAIGSEDDDEDDDAQSED